MEDKIVKALKIINLALNDGAVIIIGQSIIVGVYPDDHVLLTGDNQWFTAYEMCDIEGVQILSKNMEYSELVNKAAGEDIAL